MSDLWQDAMDHAVALARQVGSVSWSVCLREIDLKHAELFINKRCICLLGVPRPLLCQRVPNYMQCARGPNLSRCLLFDMIKCRIS